MFFVCACCLTTFDMACDLCDFRQSTVDNGKIVALSQPFAVDTICLQPISVYLLL